MINESLDQLRFVATGREHFSFNNTFSSEIVFEYKGWSPVFLFFAFGVVEVMNLL